MPASIECKWCRTTILLKRKRSNQILFDKPNLKIINIKASKKTFDLIIMLKVKYESSSNATDTIRNVHNKLDRHFEDISS